MQFPEWTECLSVSFTGRRRMFSSLRWIFPASPPSKQQQIVGRHVEGGATCTFIYHPALFIRPPWPLTSSFISQTSVSQNWFSKKCRQIINAILQIKSSFFFIYYSFSGATDSKCLQVSDQTAAFCSLHWRSLNIFHDVTQWRCIISWDAASQDRPHALHPATTHLHLHKVVCN